jgi:hypothetical protein
LLPLIAQAVIARRVIWPRLLPVNFFSFLATNDCLSISSVGPIATAQDDRYLVLTWIQSVRPDAPGVQNVGQDAPGIQNVGRVDAAATASPRPIPLRI